MNARLKMVFVSMLLSCLGMAAAQQSQPLHQPILLWPNGAPGSEGKTAPENVVTNAEGEHTVSSIHHPSLTPYLPAAARATGAAVVIAPGGGHYMLSIDHEGYDVAKWLSGHG